MEEGEGAAACKRSVVGTRISVFWPDDDAYYPGVIAARHREDPAGRPRVATIRYDDGGVEKADLAAETFLLWDGTGADAGVAIGTRLSVFWPEDDAFYPGVVEVRHRDRGGRHRVTIQYDDGDAETVDLARETIRLLGEEEDEGEPTLEAPRPRGDRIPEDSPPEAFLMHDYEIFWGDRRPERRGWRMYLPDQDKIAFYATSFENGRCEVEWDGEGQIYNAPFRKKGKRKRKTVDRISLVSPSLPKRQALRKMVSVEEEDFWPLGPAPSEPHRITDQLGMTREEVISSLPEEMVDRFCDCGWASWKNVYRPVFVLSPFDISGEGGMAEEWTKMYLSCRNKRGTLSNKMKHLVYWYETGWSTSNSKSFSLVTSIHSYETGVAKGWNKPSFANKTDGPTQYEDSILRGIQQMEKDQGRPKNERGGPLFFPELREKEKKASRKVVNSLERRYASWEHSNNYKACVNQGISSRDDFGAVGTGGLDSLELCAGEGVMSESLKRQGFASAITLDNDPKRSATSQLSLAELEASIVDGQIHLHPDLNKAFSVIWAGPECRTWSRAQNGRYRSKDFIEGRGNRVLDVDAQQARNDIESLANILSFYKSRNPALVMVIENPVGYLVHHPCSGLFGSILGLELVKISYCQFSGGSTLYPQKDTHLWTNSGLLLHEFGSGEFECTPNKECMGRVDGKHLSRAQDLPGKCAAYPSNMCAFIAPLLFADALKGTFGTIFEASDKKKGRAKRVSTSSLSLSDDEAN